MPVSPRSKLEREKRNDTSDIIGWLRGKLERIECHIPGYADAAYSDCVYQVALEIGAQGFVPPKGKQRP